MSTPAIDALIEERASADDRRWFVAHASRRYRVRPTYPGELGAADATHIIAVQHAPGTRARHALSCSQPPPDHDDALACLVHLVMRQGWALVHEDHDPRSTERPS